MSTSSPFSTQSSTLINQSHLDDWNKALKALDVAENEAYLLQRAGVDQSDNLQKISSARTQILQFKQVYFPGQ